MATKRKTTKKPVEPVIEYVDPETNLETPETEVEVEKTPETPTDDLFACMKRRREKEK